MPIPHLPAPLSTGAPRLARAALAAGLLCACATAQDTLVLDDGTEVEGRVTEAFDPAVWRIDVDGRAREIPRGEVRETRLLNDRLAAFLDLRQPGMDGDSAARLAEQAAAAGLDHIARLQAYQALLIDPDQEAAHEFLDHKKRGKSWRWRLDGKLLKDERFFEAFEDMGDAEVLRSTHFEVRSSAGLRAAVDALFDLERLYVTWLAEFGPELRPREILEPIRFQIHGDPEKVSFHSFVLRHVHYDPGRLLGNAQQPEPRAVTYVPGIGQRPVRLFDLGAQALLYHGLLGEQLTLVPRDTRVYRECTLIEVGFGGWMQWRLRGPLGHARFEEDVAFDPATLDLAEVPARSEPLENVKVELERLVVLAYGRLQMIRAENPLYWARCRAWGEFFLGSGETVNGRALRDGWARLVRDLYLETKGTARPQWETAFGVSLETLETAYGSWLAAH